MSVAICALRQQPIVVFVDRSLLQAAKRSSPLLIAVAQNSLWIWCADYRRRSVVWLLLLLPHWQHARRLLPRVPHSNVVEHLNAPGEGLLRDTLVDAMESLHEALLRIQQIR